VLSVLGHVPDVDQAGVLAAQRHWGAVRKVDVVVVELVVADIDGDRVQAEIWVAAGFDAEGPAQGGLDDSHHGIGWTG
jgi:hypothetical protein